MTRKKQSLFGTDGIRGRAGVYPVTAETFEKLGKALSIFLNNKTGNSRQVFLARDTRESGPLLESSLAKGLREGGFEVHLLGILPTAGLAYLTHKEKAQLGVMITASHNPFDENGIKIFGQKGEKISPKEESEIENLFFNEEPDEKSPRQGKVITREGLVETYCEFLRSCQLKKSSLKEYKIILDCANGSASEIAPKVFQSLGAQVIKTHCAGDGTKINHQCGALHPHALAERVKKEKAHVGFSFDGDADRLVAADEKGFILDGDDLLFILSFHLGLRQIVGTVMTNTGLEASLEERGGELFRSEVGDSNVLALMKQEKIKLGGEPSGHIIYKPLLPTSDALLTALLLLNALFQSKKSLHELSQGLIKLPQETLSLPVKEKIPLTELPHFSKALEEVEEKLQPRGRVFFRYSGTENLARIMVEGEKEEEVKEVLETLKKNLKKDFSGVV